MLTSGTYVHVAQMGYMFLTTHRTQENHGEDCDRSVRSASFTGPFKQDRKRVIMRGWDNAGLADHRSRHPMDPFHQ